MSEPVINRMTAGLVPQVLIWQAGGRERLIFELRQALDNIKTLSGMLPIALPVRR